MLSARHIRRISLLLAVTSWLGLLITGLFSQFSAINNIDSGINKSLPIILLDLFIVLLFIYYRFRIGKAESVNFIDLLWRVFVTGLVATVVSLFIQFFFFMMGNSKLASNALLIDFFYHINLGLTLAFLLSTFVVWKRLILYQKNRWLLTAWNAFEYLLLGSLVVDFFNLQLFESVSLFIIVPLLILGFVLSVNLKWIAYLNFKQKWKAILLILLVILYLWYFLKNLLEYSTSYHFTIEPTTSVFMLSLVIFILAYAIFSLLVILFNLPTSSVFEKKLEEVINFQRLSKTVTREQQEESVYEILLDSAASSVLANAAWLEVYGAEGRKNNTYYTRDLSKNEIPEIIGYINKASVKKVLDRESSDDPENVRLSANLRHPDYKSILVYPLFVQSEQVGTLVLLQDVKDGFNKEMIDIINAFCNQASISLENFRLLGEALENERYREALKIAKKVQRSLLPHSVLEEESLSMVSFSEAADEVGGDYYDFFRINDHKLAVIIGDVSGKGTSAAFHMSQMKGVFHSLVDVEDSPADFIIQANAALSRCLDKSSFITASYFLINTNTRTVEFVRAGHCPTLYYSKETQSACYYADSGLGLGILRNSEYSRYVQTNTVTYQPGDVMFLYTDGIVEARNKEGEEYGYERLKNLIQKEATGKPKDISDKVLEDLYLFSGEARLDDDYTALVIKFL
ncbi:GAF domain-containing SpoIIE family protein phosphatase [Roseivirga sp. BDSF3-8]|uniref:GAF domain-containing SpoIIE family protein phosphatase n=1 Tax=Roseivirga sp. BDSF3-8 TaxID=3241598 RepID=UPI003531E50C